VAGAAAIQPPAATPEPLHDNGVGDASRAGSSSRIAGCTGPTNEGTPLWLAHLMPYLLTPIVLMVFAPLLMIAGALLGPETREAELHLPDLGVAPCAASAAVSAASGR
jgi:hypothetical protein